MKIGISLLGAREHRTGVESSAFSLIAELNKLDTNDEFVIYASVRNLPWLRSVSSRMQVVDVRLSSRRALWSWEHLFFLTDRRARELSLVHFPIGGGVVGYNGSFVLTIHDLKHYHSKDVVKWHRHMLWRTWCNANIKRAAKVITVSQHVKEDVLCEFPITEDRVHVVPNGVDHRFRPCPDAHVRCKYNLPETYVLFVGQTSANKNLRRAVDAMALARGTSGVNHTLVIAGPPGDDHETLIAYVKRQHLNDFVRFIGYVDEDDLPHLYSGAALFLFPSLTEGFGIPPLEAMRCGVPVVAARASCLPEVLGDAAIWVDPMSEQSIASGIITGLLDKVTRERAVNKGFGRAKQFSWKETALRTLEVYREAALQ